MAPICPICSSRHTDSQAHRFAVSQPVVHRYMANTPEPVANSVANKDEGMANALKVEAAKRAVESEAISTYRYRDEEARRHYQRDLMRKRRANGR